MRLPCRCKASIAQRCTDVSGQRRWDRRLDGSRVTKVPLTTTVLRPWCCAGRRGVAGRDAGLPCHLHKGRRPAVGVAAGVAAWRSGRRRDPVVPAGGPGGGEVFLLHAAYRRGLHRQVVPPQREPLPTLRDLSWSRAARSPVPGACPLVMRDPLALPPCKVEKGKQRGRATQAQDNCPGQSWQLA